MTSLQIPMRRQNVDIHDRIRYNSVLIYVAYSHDCTEMHKRIGHAQVKLVQRGV